MDLKSHQQLYYSTAQTKEKEEGKHVRVTERFLHVYRGGMLRVRAKRGLMQQRLAIS